MSPRLLLFAFILALCVGAARGSGNSEPLIDWQVTTTKARFHKGERIELQYDLKNRSRKHVLVFADLTVPREVSLSIYDSQGRTVPFEGISPSTGPERKFELLRAGTEIRGTLLIPISCGVQVSQAGFCLKSSGKYTAIATYNKPPTELLDSVQCPALISAPLRSTAIEFSID